jgi:cohesin complex subunit SA-1/2
MSSQATDITSSAPRRRSGRVPKEPERFVPASSPATSAKRKRGQDTEADIDMEDAASEEEPEESSEGEPDEEELREQRRKNKKKNKGKAAARKPAQKKAKTNGEAVNLAIRPAANTKAVRVKARKTAPIRKSAVADAAEGLYGAFYGPPHVDGDA